MSEQKEILCPYCGEINLIEIYTDEGKSQSFVQDCEICCRPIEISINLDKDGNINTDVKNEEGF